MPKSVPEVPGAPAPVGPYSIAAEAHGFVFLSGQVAFDPATGNRVDESVETEADQIMKNIGSILNGVGLGYEDVVKTTIFLTDIDEFSTVNDVYGRFFTGAPPARSTVQVAALPVGFRVEIEVVAAR